MPTVLQILGTVLLLGMALLAPFVGIIGLYASLVLVVTWYACIGHHAVGWLINRVFRTGSDTPQPKSIYEKRIEKLLRQKKIDEAILSCREWVHHERDAADPQLKLAEVLVNGKKDLSQAIRELEIAVSRPYSAEARVPIALKLAELYQKAGRSQEVKPMFHRIRSLHANSPMIEALKL